MMVYLRGRQIRNKVGFELYEEESRVDPVNRTSKESDAFLPAPPPARVFGPNSSPDELHPVPYQR